MRENLAATAGKLVREYINGTLLPYLRAEKLTSVIGGELRHTSSGKQIIVSPFPHPWRVTYNGTTFDVATGYVTPWSATSGGGAGANLTPVAGSATGLAKPAADKYAALYVKVDRTSDTVVALTVAKAADADTAALAYKAATDLADYNTDYVVLAIVSGNSPYSIDQRTVTDLYPNVLGG